MRCGNAMEGSEMAVVMAMAMPTHVAPSTVHGAGANSISLSGGKLMSHVARRKTSGTRHLSTGGKILPYM